MTAAKKPRSGPGSRTGAAARSGPAIADAQRQRPARRVTLSPEAWALLDAQRAESEDSVSAQLDALVLSRGAEERHLSPAILERLQALAARRGDPLWLVADEVLDAGLDLLESSEGAAPGDPTPVVRELEGGGVAIGYRQAK